MSVGLAYPELAKVSGLERCDRLLHAAEGMPFTYFRSSEKVCSQRNDSFAAQEQNVWMEHNHIRAWRKFRNMTLDELAAAVGSTKATVQQLEVGLGTTPGMLLDHDPNDLPTSVLETWAAIPEESQPQALKVLESFKRTGTEG